MTTTEGDDVGTPMRLDVQRVLSRISDSAAARVAGAVAAYGALDRDDRETPEDTAARLAMQARHRTARWTASLPVMFEGASLDHLRADPVQADAASEIVGWIERGDATLILAGPVGVGKTYAAYAAANFLAGQCQWVEAWTVGDLLEAMRPNGDPAASRVARDCDVLILDDLGAARGTDWAVEQFTALLDARLRKGKRQIVTTNHAYSALEASWGGRAMDRLRFRMCAVTMTGESRRKAAW